MKKNTSISNARVLVSSLALLLLSALPLSAEQFGLFTYSVTDENTVTITDYPEDATGEVVIPSEIGGMPVTSIANSAFSGCSGLTSVTILDSVAEIDPYAFSGCSGLTSVTIGDSVTEIGNSAFSGCSGLTSVTIPDSVTEIGSGAFSDCVSLTSVTFPDSVTSIGAYAFHGCSGLTSVTIPDSVTSIGAYAFRDCSSLTSLEVAAGNTHFSSVEGVLFNTVQTRLIQYPADRSGAYSIPDSVTSIGEAFYGCSGLTSVTIGNSVTSMGYRAFFGCIGLTSLEVAAGNTHFSSVGGVLFDTVQTRLIQYPADRSGTYSIPDSVTSIGVYAFHGCSGLTSVTIPDSVRGIGRSSFSGCSGLTSFEVGAGHQHLSSVEGVLFNTDQTSLILFPEGRSGAYSIPDSVTTIRVSAFYGCSGLTSVTIPDSVTEMREWAFRDCSGLTSVTIGNSVTTIYYGAFRDCSGLTSVTIGNSVTSIGSGDPSFGGTFEGCSGLTSVTIPDSVTSTGQYAFRDCRGLTSVTIGNSVRGIGDYAFNRCSGLTSVTIPDSVTAIGSSAFRDCSGLTSVTIPDSVTRIGWSSFSGCSGLTSVTIGNSVTAIGSGTFSFPILGVFEDCSGLTSILFLGDAPTTPFAPFDGTSDNLTIFYLSGRTGFTPIWNERPTVMLESASDFAVPSWLLSQDLPHDTDLAQDLNGDGYPLLTAYALDLDHSLNLASQMPKPELGEGTMAMSFYGDAQGIRYLVETSTDLQNWTSEGVTMSGANEEGMRSATVERDSPRRFLRLVVGRQ